MSKDRFAFVVSDYQQFDSTFTGCFKGFLGLDLLAIAQEGIIEGNGWSNTRLLHDCSVAELSPPACDAVRAPGLARVVRNAVVQKLT